MARIRPPTTPKENPQPPAQSPARDRAILQRFRPQHRDADLQAAQQIQARDESGEKREIVEGGDGGERGEEEGGCEQEAVCGQVWVESCGGVD